MQKSFPGFYSPSEDELTALWRDGVFVLDASVLLKLYEVPEKTREETFDAFKKLGKRLWVPHQAALEYQRNRAKTIGLARARVSDALEPMELALQNFMKAAKAVKLSERGYDDAAKRLADMGDCGDAVIAAARKAIENQVEVSGDDPIRRQLDTLLAGQVGEPPTADQIVEWDKDAERRYTHRMGPGHLDQGKVKNSTYMLDGLIFDKRFGDLYLWKETILHSSSPEISRVVLITNDSKADWWKVTDHGVAGPLPELCSEIRKDAGLSGFWMYDLESFLREAEHRLNVNVSKTTLSDMAFSTHEFVEYADEVVRSRANWREEEALPWDLDKVRNSELYKKLGSHTTTLLSRRLKKLGFRALDNSAIGVGYKTDEGVTCVGIAVLEQQLSHEPIITLVRSEIETMISLMHPKHVQLYVYASGETGTGNGLTAAYRLSKELKQLESDEVTFTVFYGVGEETLAVR